MGYVEEVSEDEGQGQEPTAVYHARRKPRDAGTEPAPNVQQQQISNDSDVTSLGAIMKAAAGDSGQEQAGAAAPAAASAVAHAAGASSSAAISEESAAGDMAAQAPLRALQVDQLDGENPLRPKYTGAPTAPRPVKVLHYLNAVALVALVQVAALFMSNGIAPCCRLFRQCVAWHDAVQLPPSRCQEPPAAATSRPRCPSLAAPRVAVGPQLGHATSQPHGPPAAASGRQVAAEAWRAAGPAEQPDAEAANAGHAGQCRCKSTGGSPATKQASAAQRAARYSCTALAPGAQRPGPTSLAVALNPQRWCRAGPHRREQRRWRRQRQQQQQGSHQHGSLSYPSRQAFCNEAGQGVCA
jgi:hypothetical protein